MRKIIFITLFLVFLLTPFLLKADTIVPTVEVSVSYNDKELSENFYYLPLFCQTRSEIQEDTRHPESKIDQDPLIYYLISLISNNEISEEDYSNYVNIFKNSIFEDASCIWLPDLHNVNWTIFKCPNGNCEPRAMFFSSDKFKLAFYLPFNENIYISEPVINNNIQSKINVDIDNDKITAINNKDVTKSYKTYNNKGIFNEIFENIKYSFYDSFDIFLIALIITLLIETFVTLLFIRYKQINKNIIIKVIIINIISVLIIWIFSVNSYLLPIDNLILLVILAEVFVFLFEGVLLYLFNKKYLSFKNSLFLSLLMNLSSFISGLGFIYLIYRII